MVSRSTACWLIVLVLAPFTAPFPTCDLVTLFGGAPARQTPANLPGAATLADETSVASVPAISHIGRVRLLQLSALSASLRERVPPSSGLMLIATSHRHVHDRIVLSTILRV
jgi:hypothetical protein